MEHQPVVVESLAEEQTLLEHPAPMGAQHVDGCLVERDRSAAAVRLRLADRHRVPDSKDRLDDPDPPAVEIDVAPPESESLAAARPGRGEQDPR